MIRAAIGMPFLYYYSFYHFNHRSLCLAYNDAASHATAVSRTFKHMKVRKLSYNGATAATTSFKNFEFAAQRRQYKSKNR